MTTLAKPITGLISGTYNFTEDADYLNAPIILVILSSMMITYSISDIIYGQILLPTKKEKYYLYALLGGTILNAVLSVVFGKYVFTNNPGLGVAIGTSVTDLLILVFLCSVSWKWIKKAIFNFNSLKIFAVTLVILGISLLLRNPLYNLGYKLSNNYAVALVVELLGVVLLDAVVYIVALLLLKEDLISSFFRKKENVNG